MLNKLEKEILRKCDLLADCILEWISTSQNDQAIVSGAIQTLLQLYYELLQDEVLEEQMRAFLLHTVLPFFILISRN